MSYQDVKVGVSNYMTAQWGAAEQVTVGATNYKLIVENTKFNASLRADPSAPWLRWGIRPFNQQMGDIGARMKRDEGEIWFQIFLAPDTGESAALLIGDEITNKFFQKDIVIGAQRLKTFAANLSHVGDDGTGWILWSVKVPYQLDSP